MVISAIFSIIPIDTALIAGSLSSKSIKFIQSTFGGINLSVISRAHWLITNGFKLLWLSGYFMPLFIGFNQFKVISEERQYADEKEREKEYQ